MIGDGMVRVSPSLLLLTLLSHVTAQQQSEGGEEEEKKIAKQDVKGVVSLM